MSGGVSVSVRCVVFDRSSRRRVQEPDVVGVAGIGARVGAPARRGGVDLPLRVPCGDTRARHRLLSQPRGLRGRKKGCWRSPSDCSRGGTSQTPCSCVFALCGPMHSPVRVKGGAWCVGVLEASLAPGFRRERKCQPFR